MTVQYIIQLFNSYVNMMMLNLVEKPKTSPLKDSRKQQLIDATIDCIYQYGLDQTTVTKVTQAAELSAGTVNFYFDTKEKLLLGTLSSIRDEFHIALVQSIDTSLEPGTVLDQIINVHFDPDICRPEKIAVWTAFSVASRTRQDYHSICGNLDQSVSNLLTKQIERLCKIEGNKHYSHVALARGLEGMLDSLWQQYLYQPAQFDLAEAANQCRQYLHSMFPKHFSINEQSFDVALENAPSLESDLLPTWTYTSPEFLQLEIEHLFKRNWMLVGHISEVSNARDYLTFNAFGERALVIRGEDKKIRAFHNVCRHRGAQLLPNNSGICPHALSCPFHGWTYDLTGKLIAVPGKDTFDNLNLAKNSLVALEFEIWMGFIFIRFISGGTSLKEHMAPVESMIEPYQIANMQPIKGSEFDHLRPYNWKVIHDIDNEGYHVPVGHPSLQQLYGSDYKDENVENIPMSSARLNEKPGRIWSVQKYQKILPEFPHLPKENQRLWLYFGIFPNHVLGLYPDCIEFYMTIPQSAHTTRYIGKSYGLADDRPEAQAARFLNRRINYLTDLEDESFVKGLQDGMKSSVFPQQQLSSREQGVRQFHENIQSILPISRQLTEPRQIYNAGF